MIFGKMLIMVHGNGLAVRCCTASTIKSREPFTTFLTVVTTDISRMYSQGQYKLLYTETSTQVFEEKLSPKTE